MSASQKFKNTIADCVALAGGACLIDGLHVAMDHTANPSLDMGMLAVEAAPCAVLYAAGLAGAFVSYTKLTIRGHEWLASAAAVACVAAGSILGSAGSVLAHEILMRDAGHPHHCSWDAPKKSDCYCRNGNDVTALPPKTIAYHRAAAQYGL